MTDQTPSGGVGPLHEAVAAAINSADGGPANADDWSRQAADAALRVVGTQLHAEIEALYGTGETAMSRPTKSRMLAVVAELLGHPDA